MSTGVCQNAFHNFYPLLESTRKTIPGTIRSAGLPLLILWVFKDLENKKTWKFDVFLILGDQLL